MSPRPAPGTAPGTGPTERAGTLYTGAIKGVGTVSGLDVRDLLVNGLGRTQGPEVL
ncbi:hypothetical protein [Streptomyces sp. Ncost-T10-10d]|uniref:hypothetical protein n=1 Tax=Streptomyces sp. Ncost-T10-10d TaxID=1839774 RepID=UPI00159F2E6F|nr:hypothetical protein [Streptomyces sp. Ncost-T10-10d]